MLRISSKQSFVHRSSVIRQIITRQLSWWFKNRNCDAISVDKRSNATTADTNSPKMRNLWKGNIEINLKKANEDTTTQLSQHHTQKPTTEIVQSSQSTSIAQHSESTLLTQSSIPPPTKSVKYYTPFEWPLAAHYLFTFSWRQNPPKPPDGEDPQKPANGEDPQKPPNGDDPSKSSNEQNSQMPLNDESPSTPFIEEPPSTISNKEPLSTPPNEQSSSTSSDMEPSVKYPNDEPAQTPSKEESQQTSPDEESLPKTPNEGPSPTSPNQESLPQPANEEALPISPNEEPPNEKLSPSGPDLPKPPNEEDVPTSPTTECSPSPSAQPPPKPRNEQRPIATASDEYPSTPPIDVCPPVTMCLRTPLITECPPSPACCQCPPTPPAPPTPPCYQCPPTPPAPPCCPCAPTPPAPPCCPCPPTPPIDECPPTPPTDECPPTSPIEKCPPKPPIDKCPPKPPIDKCPIIPLNEPPPPKPTNCQDQPKPSNGQNQPESSSPQTVLKHCCESIMPTGEIIELRIQSDNPPSQQSNASSNESESQKSNGETLPQSSAPQIFVEIKECSGNTYINQFPFPGDESVEKPGSTKNSGITKLSISIPHWDNDKTSANGINNRTESLAQQESYLISPTGYYKINGNEMKGMPPGKHATVNVTIKNGKNQFEIEKTLEETLKPSLPKLENTIIKYMDLVRPLLTKKQFVQTEKSAIEFIEKDGKLLQLSLERKCKKREKLFNNWKTESVFSNIRDSVLINSSRALVFPVKNFDSEIDVLKYAAKLIYGTLQFKDKVHQLNEMDSMSSKLWGLSRIPGEKFDSIESSPDSTHIVVAFKNQFYKLPVYNINSTEKLSEYEIPRQLCQMTLIDLNGDNEEVGIITAAQRDFQALTYKSLMEDKTNKASIECINKALFMVCIDVASGEKMEYYANASRRLIHGGGTRKDSANRWFNKPLQYIISANDGVNGLCYESTSIDEMAITKLVENVTDFLKSKPTDISKNIHPQKRTEVMMEEPRKLNFNISEDIQNDINATKSFVNKLSSNLNIKVHHFKNHGANFIKEKNYCLDSFIQVAAQLAYHRIHRKSTIPRQIIKNNNKIQSFSNEFAEIMDDKKANSENKIKALQTAINSYKNYTIAALHREHTNKHLLELQQIANESKRSIPQFFKDDGYKMFSSYRVATKKAPFKNGTIMSCGPTVENGYGISYNPQNDDIYFSVSAFKSNNNVDAAKMANALIEALDNMCELCNSGDEKNEIVS